MSISEETQIEFCEYAGGETAVSHCWKYAYFQMHTSFLRSDHFVSQTTEALDLSFKHVATLKYANERIMHIVQDTIILSICQAWYLKIAYLQELWWFARESYTSGCAGKDHVARQ